MPAGGYRANAPLFKSSWRHQGTTTIRVPVVFADLLLAIARGIDTLDSLNIFSIARTVTRVVVQEKLVEPVQDDKYLKEAVAKEVELDAEPVEDKFLEKRTFDEIKRIQLLKIALQLGKGQNFDQEEARELDLPWSKCSEFIIDVLDTSPQTERKAVVEGLLEFSQWSYFYGIAGRNKAEIDSLFGEVGALKFLYYQRNLTQPIYTKAEFQKWQKSVTDDEFISMEDNHNDP